MPKGSIWLVPATADEVLLNDRIRDLAHQLRSPLFTPHVTVLGNFDWDGSINTVETVTRVLDQKVHEQNGPVHFPITLETNGIDASTDRFQALYIKFENAQRLDKLRMELKEALNLSNPEMPHPHLSLAYPEGVYDTAEMNGMRWRVPLERNYRFDRLAFVTPRDSDNSWDAIAEWRNRHTTEDLAGQMGRRRVVVIFPYYGWIYKNDDPSTKNGDRSQMFWNIFTKAQELDSSHRPVIVMNADTEARGQAKLFHSDERSKNADVVPCWSVDTCQMWLTGWGKVLGEKDNTQDSRIVLVPGDFERMHDEVDFLRRLGSFATSTEVDILIGDYESPQRSSKALIDTYGTYSLLTNWFPEVWHELRKMRLNKPRSEFLNIRSGVLRLLLNERKFGYEQTLNMLVRNWVQIPGQQPPNPEDPKPELLERFSVDRHELGPIQDNGDNRSSVKGCVDQIERTERMLKLVWRELSEKEPKALYDEYEVLDRRSTSIRENAILTLRVML